MRTVSLESDDRHLAIIQTPVLDEFRRAGKVNAKQLLRRTATVLDLGEPETRIETLEGCSHLQKLTAGNEYRLYCVFESSMPGHKLLHALGITPHNYRDSKMQSLDPKAGRLRGQLKDLHTTAAVREYLEERRAFSPDELYELAASW